MDIATNGLVIENPGKFNILLGKNGVGKSTFLRTLEQGLILPQRVVSYVTPERGGTLQRDPNSEYSTVQNASWLPNVRRSNRFINFRETSANRFRDLETLSLRKLERSDSLRRSGYKFDSELNKINSVLHSVKMERGGPNGFQFRRKTDDSIVEPTQLSSGDSELSSLAIEILYFKFMCESNDHIDQENYLLFDEPDVHLHQDLQDSLVKLMVNELTSVDATIFIATHSTSVVSSFARLTDHARIGFFGLYATDLTMIPINDALTSLLPMFGAHPLTNVFNERPPLVVEGEDDERIWQTACRSSGGRIAFYPCVAGDIQSISRFEGLANDILGSVYDNAKAFSLRDRDDAVGELADLEKVIRLRLHCRAAENLLLTDDCLHIMGLDWAQFQEAMEQFIESEANHVRHPDAVAFRDSGWNRKHHPLKPLRMLLVAQSGSNKPWEVIVGRAIAQLSNSQFNGDHSMRDYLGEKAIQSLGL